MARSWIVDGRAIARKVKTSNLPLVNQIKDCGAIRECPQCHYRIDNSDVSVEWPGLPVGVKFEPTDAELLEHLAAKCGVGNEKPHQFIDEFIPTLDVDDGICSKHPENLPGATKDGNTIHFFYRTTNAYTTGQRKRRKICKDSGLTNESNLSKDRWHKTGKTKAIMQNGVQIGCKKIMVLYGAAGGGSKPYKLNWVMHQYHLGIVEDEKEGEYVVAKIFYQPQKDTEKVDNNVVVEELDPSPRTPNTDAPHPRRPLKTVSSDDITTDHVIQSPEKESGWCVEQKYIPSSSVEIKANVEISIWEDDLQVVDLDSFDDSLFCNENFDTYDPISRLNNGPHSDSNVDAECAPGSSRGASSKSGSSRGASSKFDDLVNLDLGTPPDFNLADLHFSSQDSIFGLLERL